LPADQVPASETLAARTASKPRVQLETPMNSSFHLHPLTLGLFEKRIAGDDSLTELARLRFSQAGMGAEMHAGTPEQLDGLLKFRPSPNAPVTVHLPRDFNLMDEHARTLILDFASRFAGRVYGLVVHDRTEMVTRRESFLQVARELDSRLGQIDRCPMLFIEYAVGLEPETFAGFFESIAELTRISACIDIGHIGIWQARNAYSQMHPGEDICSLKVQNFKLPQVMADVERAAGSALPTVLNLVEAVGRSGKPVHFHLHDGHPLSTFSSFGVSDHLSFLQEIPLGFEYRGKRSVPSMFGLGGLSQVVAKAIETIGCDRVSFTLEIHPTADRLPLGDAASLFGHWRDKSNAERMNHWLSLLSQNHNLLITLWAKYFTRSY
jgi:hypothetical protein